MRTIKDVNPAQAYFEGMLWAAFGVRIFSDNAAEWQIEAVKKYAKKTLHWFQQRKKTKRSCGSNGLTIQPKASKRC